MTVQIAVYLNADTQGKKGKVTFHLVKNELAKFVVVSKDCDLAVGRFVRVVIRDPARTDPVKQVGQRRIWEDFDMYKLISIILAAIPVILFLRTIFIGQLKRSQAVSDFRKQIDYLVWIILILIGRGLSIRLGS
jgi:hypothetical protein